MAGLGAIAILLGLSVGWLITRMTLWRAVHSGLVQVPNARSSHKRPTPTGGGIGIVAGSLAGASVLVWFDPLAIGPVLIGGLIIAAIGLLDDIRPMGAGRRLLIRAVVLGLVLGSNGSLPIFAAALGLQSAWIVPVAALVILFGTYWINLFNFMDGIDGLAGSEALFLLGASAGLIMITHGSEIPILWWSVSVAAASPGFLLLNWPPAKIFMGDVGSTFLGFAIACLAVWEITQGWLSLPAWLILVALFAVDASVTLAHRLLRGERIWEAHRRHAYQVLARRFGSHRPVTLGFIAINVFGLLPLAVLVETRPQLGWVIAILVYAVLAAGAVYAGAGRPELKSG